MHRARALDQLAACLQGRPPPGCDWAAVLELANHSLATPSLAAAVGEAPGVPGEVRVFLDEVRERNRERNRRLQVQLADAVAALNASGLEPVLLKGAARLACRAPDAPFDRLLSDLDLMVAPQAVEEALAALERAGFAVLNRYDGATVHVAAELGRPQDPGLIDLHQRPPGPPALAETAELAARRRRVALDGGHAQVPDAASQLLHLVLHDQFHDGGYWRGGFDLRHLLDTASLASALSASDWAWLRRACGTDLVRRALDAQLTAAATLAGGIATEADPGARRTWRRWRRQFAAPMLRLPLAVFAAASEWRVLAAHRAAIGGVERATLTRRAQRYGRILRVETGKL